MLKYRIIIFITAVAAIVFLYSLPSVVVDNDKGAIEGNSESKGVPDLFDSVPENFPEEVNINLLKYRAYLNDENISLAKAYADSIIELFVNQTRFDSAAKYSELILKMDSSENMILKTGDLYFEAYSYAMDRDRASMLGGKCRYYYEKILIKHPERLDLKNKVAMTYISSSNPMRGIAMLREILESDPENEQAIYNMGLLAVQSGQWDKAIDRFEQLIRINPKNIQAQFYLGLGYYESGQKEKAKEQFHRVRSMGYDETMLVTVDNYLKELN